MNKKIKNKIYTPGYFIKRLRDNNFIVLRIFQDYSDADSRRWTVLVDPGNTSVYITCVHDALDKEDSVMFYFDDGGRLFPKNTFIKTLSIEVIVNKLISEGIPQTLKNSRFIKDLDLNSIDDRSGSTRPGADSVGAEEEAIKEENN